MRERQGGPLGVARQARGEALGEEPLEPAQRAGQRLALDEPERGAKEWRGVVGVEPSGPRHEVGEALDVAVDAVRLVEPRGGDRVQPRAPLVDPEAAPHRARGVGQRARRRVGVGAREDPRAQPLARHRLAPVEREVRDHLDAAPAQRGDEGLDEPDHPRRGAQQLDAHAGRARRLRRAPRRHRDHRDAARGELGVERRAGAEEDDRRPAQASRGEGAHELGLGARDVDAAAGVQAHHAVRDLVGPPPDRHAKAPALAREGDLGLLAVGDHARDDRLAGVAGGPLGRRARDAHDSLAAAQAGAQVRHALRVEAPQGLDLVLHRHAGARPVAPQRVGPAPRRQREGERAGPGEG